MRAIIYEADKYHNAEYDDVSASSFILKFHFMSPMVEILEEIPEISFPDFAGSVGGSLGLFIGFSCYTFLSKIVDTFFAYCFWIKATKKCCVEEQNRAAEDNR